MTGESFIPLTTVCSASTGSCVVAVSIESVGNSKVTVWSVMSYEPGRKVAYSVDLRHRMIWQRFAMEEQFRSIAQNLGVSVGTVYNICKIFERTGCVDASKRPSKHSSSLSI